MELEYSVLKNCHITPKQSQTTPMFRFLPDGTCIINLDGYIIVPIDDYYLQSEDEIEQLTDQQRYDIAMKGLI